MAQLSEQQRFETREKPFDLVVPGRRPPGTSDTGGGLTRRNPGKRLPQILMDLADFALVSDVHLMDSVNCTKAVWDIMREQQYGRIVMTTSSSGMYGNFGQSNYGAAKMGVLGLMNTLVIEGEKANIRINALAPGAATRMTEDLLQEEVKQLLTVEPVAEAMIVLCHADAPNHCILNAQAGSYSVTRLVESQGMWLPKDKQTAEEIVAHWDRIADHAAEQAMKNGGEHVMKMVMLAAKGLGVA